MNENEPMTLGALQGILEENSFADYKVKIASKDDFDGCNSSHTKFLIEHVKTMHFNALSNEKSSEEVIAFWSHEGWFKYAPPEITCADLLTACNNLLQDIDKSTQLFLFWDYKGLCKHPIIDWEANATSGEREFVLEYTTYDVSMIPGVEEMIAREEKERLEKYG